VGAVGLNTSTVDNHVILTYGAGLMGKSHFSNFSLPEISIIFAAILLFHQLFTS
jgi:hypothetical protein